MLVRPLIPLTPPRFPAGLFFCERPRAAIRRVVRIGPDRAVESHHTRRPTDAAARATSGSSSSRFGLSQKDGLPFPRCREERLTVQGHQREHRGDSLCGGRPEFSAGGLQAAGFSPTVECNGMFANCRAKSFAL